MRLLDDNQQYTEHMMKLEQETDRILKNLLDVDPDKYYGANIAGSLTINPDVPRYMQDFFISTYEKGKQIKIHILTDLEPRERYLLDNALRLKLDLNDIKRRD